MRRKIPLLLGGIALISLSLLQTDVRAVDQTYTVTINQGVFSTLNVTIDRLDDIKFQNQDTTQHVLHLEPQGFTASIKSKTLGPASAGAGPSSYSPSFTDAQVGVWKYFIVGQEQQGGTLTVTAAVATATPTATASSSASVTGSPSVSPTVSVTPTSSPTPTQQPTVTPTVTASATPSATPSPSVTPSMTPTSSPNVTATPSMSPTPSLHPSASPTASPTVHPTAIATPSPTPLPEDAIPGFSLFRSTQCSAEVVGNTVLTERLSATKLTRGYWDIQKLVSQNGQTSVDVDLDHVRVVNLFFRSSFFRGDVTYNNVHQQATFQGSSLNNVLQSAATAWCQSAMRY